MLEVTVTAQQPLALGTRPRPGAPGLTHQHIPGAVLRGALAEKWIREHGVPSSDPELRAVFLDLFERGVRFGPLFAPGSTIVPLSVWTCKYRPNPACRGEWYDEAWEEVPPHCKRCEGPLSRGNGSTIHVGQDADQRVLRTMHVELTDQGTAEEGKLFTRETLAHRVGGKQVCFTGRIVGGGDWLQGEHPLHIGGRRSVAGSVTYRAWPKNPEDQPWLLPEKREERLVVRLCSPGVFVDRAGRPVDTPDIGLITKLLGTEVRDIEKWTRRDRIGGWHAAADLPKPEDHVVTAGSTYVLTLRDEPDPAKVENLLDQGLGLRRAEGFGWIEVRRWQPPGGSDDSRDSEPEFDEAARNTATMIHELPDRYAHRTSSDSRGAHTRWMCSELRGYLRHLRRGGDRHSQMLAAPRLAGLTDVQRSELKDLLLQRSPAHIQQVVSRLEALLRGVEA